MMPFNLVAGGKYTASTVCQVDPLW